MTTGGGATPWAWGFAAAGLGALGFAGARRRRRG
jgi:hypothetical protein